MNYFLAITFNFFLSFLWILNKFLFSLKERFLYWHRPCWNRPRWRSKSRGFGRWTRFVIILWLWFFYKRWYLNFGWFDLWSTKLTVWSFKTSIDQLFGKIVELVNIRVSFGSIGFISINLFKAKKYAFE